MSDSPIQDFGTELRSARETAGKTHDDLYRATRINPRFFEAMEAGDFDVLPQVLIRMFLQKYAEEVDLDPPSTIRKYEMARAPVAKPAAGAPTSRKRSGAGIGPILGVVALLVVVAAGGVYLLQEEPVEPPADTDESTTTPSTTSRSDFARSTTESSPSPFSDAPARDRVVSAYSLAGFRFDAGQDSLLQLAAHAVDDSRIEVLVDGDPAFAGRIAVGRERRWTARKRFRVDIQDAAAIDLTLQGQALKLMAKPGRKVRLFISRASIWVEEIQPSASSSR